MSEALKQAVAKIESLTDIKPDICLVLGSGLGDIADLIDGISIPYSDIPGFARAGAPSHRGVLHIGTLFGRSVAVMQGRLHLYEGHSPQEIGYPMRLMAALGVSDVILTNAAGSLSPDIAPGDISLISDHIYLPGMAGLGPLIGGDFVDMSRAYDPDLQVIARAAAKTTGVTLKSGVYACLAGPHFETPAECRYLRQIGADLVGMSTAPETVAARSVDMRVLALSAASNIAHQSAPPQSDDHIEVIWQTLTRAQPRLIRLLGEIFKRLG